MVEGGSRCSGRVYTEGRGGPRNPRKWPNVGGMGTLEGKSLRGVREEQQGQKSGSGGRFHKPIKSCRKPQREYN